MNATIASLQNTPLSDMFDVPSIGFLDISEASPTMAEGISLIDVANKVMEAVILGYVHAAVDIAFRIWNRPIAHHGNRVDLMRIIITMNPPLCFS